MVLVSTVQKTKELFSLLKKENPPYVAVDVEGENLSRDGRIAMVQLTWGNDVYLVDVHALQSKAFTLGLKQLLEDEKVVKVFCDPRNDSDALFHQFNVRMKNVFCVQLADVLYRRCTLGKRVNYVYGLVRLVESYCKLTPTAAHENEAIKEKGARLMFPDRGGSYNVLFERPLHPDVEKYAANDVEYMLEVYRFLTKALNDAQLSRVLLATEQRVLVFQTRHAEKDGPHKAVAPKF